MKVAFTTDDGQTISSHFGQARYFQVVTTEDGQVALSEQREKPQHMHSGEHAHAASRAVHPGPAMLEVISDCQALVTGGMGQPVFERAQTMGIHVYLTGEKSIDKALRSYLQGGLTSDFRRIHKPMG